MKKNWLLPIIFCIALLTLCMATVTALGEPAIKHGNESVTVGKKIYFGNYTDTSVTPSATYHILWRVLEREKIYNPGNQPKLIMMLSEQLLGEATYGHGFYYWDTNHYFPENNELKVAMNNIYNNCFTADEKMFILMTALSYGSIGDTQHSPSTAPASVDYCYPLSYPAADQVTSQLPNEVTKYLGHEPAGRIATKIGTNEAFGWWTRTVADFSVRARAISSTGEYFYPLTTTTLGLRPAAKMLLTYSDWNSTPVVDNEDAVMLLSSAVGGKKVNEGSLVHVGTSATDEWKLTLIDGLRSFTASPPTYTPTIMAGDDIAFFYLQRGDRAERVDLRDYHRRNERAVLRTPPSA